MYIYYKLLVAIVMTFKIAYVYTFQMEKMVCSSQHQFKRRRLLNGILVVSLVKGRMMGVNVELQSAPPTVNHLFIGAVMTKVLHVFRVAFFLICAIMLSKLKTRTKMS